MKKDLIFQGRNIDANTIENVVKNGKGTRLKLNNEYTSITDAIINEVGIIQKRVGNLLQLLQRVMVIDWCENEKSKYVLGETVLAIQSNASAWNMKAVSCDSGKTCSLLEHLPKKEVLNAALKLKMIKLPFKIPMVFIGVLAALMAIVGFSFLGDKFSTEILVSASVAIPVFIGALVFFIRKSIFLGKTDIGILNDFLDKNKDTPEYKNFIAQVSGLLVSEMPLVVVVEDVSKLDNFSMDLMEYVLMSDKILNIGMILWVLFSSVPNDRVLGKISKDVSVVKKHYTMERPINLAA
ncbi:MAG: hypothetical protein Q4F84_05320 [Fibrobacter sp.]|nr:hypothetical protein [Fibrobacter sp.]